MVDRRWPFVICSLQAAIALLMVTQYCSWFAIRDQSLGTVRAADGAWRHQASNGASRRADWPTSVSILRVQVPTAPISNLSTHSVSCPIFSGPGYDAKRHKSHDVSLPAFEAPFESTPRPPLLAVDAIPLSDVRLLAGSAFHAAFETNLAYLKLLSTDSLLLAWRLTAQGGKWSPGSLRLMGWGAHRLRAALMRCSSTRPLIDEQVGAHRLRAARPLPWALALGLGDGLRRHSRRRAAPPDD